MVEAEFSAVPLSPRKTRKPADRRRLSVVLSALAAQEGVTRITVRQLRDALGRRAYGAVLFLLALLNLLPLPPGGGILLALIVIVVSLQMIWGSTMPYFPRWLARRSINLADFRRVLGRLMPVIAAAERIMRPRLVRLQGRLASRAVGLVCLALGGFLLIPTPFGGNWPPALAMATLALAYLARDGLLLLLGILLSVGAMIVTWEILIRLASLLRGVLGT